jgi:hypothetical protein
MKPEGMVDALTQMHRLLEPRGLLLDIHPVPEPLLWEVHKDGALVFSAPDPDFSGDAYRTAQDALDDVVRRGLFVVEGARRFDFLIVGASLAELCAYLKEANAFEGDHPPTEEKLRLRSRLQGVMRAAGARARIATHEIGHLSCLRAVP